MGLMDGFKRRQLERQYYKDLEVFNQANAKYKESLQTIDDSIDAVSKCIAGQFALAFPDRNNFGFNLDAEEVVMGQIQGCAYLENVPAPSEWNARYGGLSTNVTRSIGANVGVSKGTITPGDDQIQMSDQGMCLITNTRVLFNGPHRHDEWRYENVMVMQHLADATIISMVGPGKPSGIGYGTSSAYTVQFRLELGMALTKNRLEPLLERLNKDRDNLIASGPVQPVPPPPASA